MLGGRDDVAKERYKGIYKKKEIKVKRRMYQSKMEINNNLKGRGIRMWMEIESCYGWKWVK